MSAPPVSPSTGLSRESVIQELESILASKIFVNSSRLSQFLRYVVEQTLDGRAESLKEYQIGTEVFGRNGGYDQRTDPVVRVEARQLRFKLAEYYAGPGRDDEIVILLPKGGYAASLERRAAPAPAQLRTTPELVQPVRSRRSARKPQLVLAIVIAAAILAAVLWVSIRGRREARHVLNPETQQLYLKGRYSWAKRTPESLNLAVDYFTQAIAHDPNYAAAYVGLADTYNLLSEYTVMPYREAFSRALAAAGKAVRLDDSMAEAHCSLAYASFWGAWDAVTAEREFKRALQLKPDYAVAHHWFATFLSVQGRFEEALREIDRAQQLDPSSTAIVADKSAILAGSGRHAEAIALASQIAGSDPSFLSAHNYLANFYLLDGDYTDYLREARTAALLEHDSQAMEMVAAGERAFEAGGAHAMLEAMLKVQQKLPTQGAPRNYQLASTCALLGARNKALDYLEAALDKRETSMLGLRIDETFKQLRGEPRFQNIVSEVRSDLAPRP
jgi:tetratricopeptide (TPR) repeat protein